MHALILPHGPAEPYGTPGPLPVTCRARPAAGNDYFFHWKSNDLLITKGNGEFATMFPMSKPDGWFEGASPYPSGGGS
jgi:hypothetical protein